MGVKGKWHKTGANEALSNKIVYGAVGDVEQVMRSFLSVRLNG